MNKFDKKFSNLLSDVYSSMCLNEYQETEEEDKDAALDAAETANDGTEVSRAKEKHDRELEKVLDQKTKNLRQASRDLKKPQA